MKPLTLHAKIKETLFNLARRAINQASVYNKLVLVNERVIIYPEDNINQVLVALKFDELTTRIAQLSNKAA